MRRVVAGFLLLAMLVGLPASVVATGATTELQIVRYAADGATVLAERTVSYEWMKGNLPVHGDGVTHYFHQGPVFEGDMWDAAETQNLKDKGAVMGTAVRDLCDLVGGMAPGDEVSLVAVD
ncbi:MAG: argininosuccinate synthase, partial [Chloroflexi bacterium]|nr:argininosuccinate synthase [Chloroflexota bacterium]